MGAASDEVVAYQPRQRHFLLDIRAMDPASLPSDNWVSRLVLLEQARWTGRVPDITEPGRMIHRVGDDHINRGFTALLVWGLRAQGITLPELVQMQHPQEGETLRQKNIREWKERILLESREKGLLEGRREGRKRGLREGRREGRLEGRLEGKRALVRNLASRKFGMATASRLPPLLDRISDLDRVSQVAAAIVDCETGEEFIARVREA